MERENEMIVISQPLFALHILLHEHIDRLIHARDGLLVILLHRFHDAVLHMLLQEELAGIIDLRTHCGELDQDIRTSAQSLWFSSIFLIDSIWPMDLDIRFMIALIFCGSCVWL